jgi:YHS domain-containing protein
MKRLMIVVLFTLFATVLSIPSIAQEKTSTKEVEKTSNQPVNTICPVSAEDVDGDITHEYKGTTYALCCKSCLKKFKQDPEKYISRLSEDGKSIKKNKGVKK